MKKKINVRLLRRVQKHILDEPKRLNVAAFIVRFGKNVHGIEFPKCGTVGCIAGWAVTLSTEAKVRYQDISRRATKLLGLTEEQAIRLFHSSYWPDEFSGELDGTMPQTEEYAQITSRFIDYFIETEE